jgi:hypothetical protein
MALLAQRAITYRNFDLICDRLCYPKKICHLWTCACIPNEKPLNFKWIIEIRNEYLIFTSIDVNLSKKMRSTGGWLIIKIISVFPDSVWYTLWLHELESVSYIEPYLRFEMQPANYHILWWVLWFNWFVFIPVIPSSRVCVIRFGYTNDQTRAVMHNSIDITFVSSAFIFMPLYASE